MEFTSSVDGNGDVCTIRVDGEVRRPEDSIRLQEFVRGVGEERGNRRFLLDMTRAEIVTRPMDTFRVGEVPVDFGPDPRRYKVALVYSGSLTEHKFMETVAVNRGYRIRVFGAIDEALSWLKGADQMY